MKKYKHTKSLILSHFSREFIQRSSVLLLEYMFKVMQEEKNDVIDFELTSTKEGVRIRFTKND